MCGYSGFSPQNVWNGCWRPALWTLGDLLVASVTVMHKMPFKMDGRLSDIKDIIIPLNYQSAPPRLIICRSGLNDNKYTHLHRYFHKSIDASFSLCLLLIFLQYIAAITHTRHHQSRGCVSSEDMKTCPTKHCVDSCPEVSGESKDYEQTCHSSCTCHSNAFRWHLWTLTCEGGLSIKR